MSEDKKLPEIPVEIPPLNRRLAGKIEHKIFTNRNLIFVQQDMLAIWGYSRSMGYMAFAYAEMAAVLPKIFDLYRSGKVGEDRDQKYCEFINTFVRYTEYLGSSACVMLPGEIMENIHDEKVREKFSHDIIVDVLKEISRREEDFGGFPNFDEDKDD